jgi:hypothetical protein
MLSLVGWSISSGDTRHDNWLVHCNVLTKLLGGGFLEECVDIFMEVTGSVGFLDLLVLKVM